MNHPVMRDAAVGVAGELEGPIDAPRARRDDLDDQRRCLSDVLRADPVPPDHQEIRFQGRVSVGLPVERREEDEMIFGAGGAEEQIQLADRRLVPESRSRTHQQCPVDDFVPEPIAGQRLQISTVHSPSTRSGCHRPASRTSAAMGTIVPDSFPSRQHSCRSGRRHQELSTMPGRQSSACASAVKHALMTCNRCLQGRISRIPCNSRPRTTPNALRPHARRRPRPAGSADLGLRLRARSSAFWPHQSHNRHDDPRRGS